MRDARQSRLTSWVFFLDRNLGKETVAHALRERIERVEIHDDHFYQNALDTEWLPVVGARGWVLLTKDKRIRHRASERQALMQAGVPAFVLTSGSLTGQQTAEAFLQALPAMQRFLDRHRPPFIAAVTRIGKVSMLVTA